MTEAKPHTNAALVSIGDELVAGNALDTNSRWLAHRLAELGITVTEHATLPDEPDAITHALERLAHDNNLIVCTGGLGPTQDDLTRDALAALLKDELVNDDEQLKRLRNRYEQRGRTLDQRDRQALRPASARMLTNHHGTAPGILATLHRDKHSTDIALLPGPPNEMVPMFENALAPQLKRPPDTTIAFRAIQHFGIGESDAARILGDILDRHRSPLVGITASDGVITTRIRYQGPDDAARTALDDADRAIEEKLGRFRVATGAHTLYHAAIEALVRNRAGLVCAESCTGGGISEHFTSIPGSSRAFFGGWITYANAHKAEHLGVPEQTLADHGAVSATVAEAMATGALANAGRIDEPIERLHAVAVTGIAGPGGEVAAPDGKVRKPVGTVFIAHAAAPLRSGRADPSAASTLVRRFEFPGNRERVRARACSTSAAMVLFAALARPLPDPMLWQVPLDHRL